MARIEETAFRQYVDGRDRMTAQEYMRDREIIRQSVNDLEDKYLVLDDINRQFTDTNSEISQNRQAVETGLLQLSQGIDQANQTFQSIQNEITSASNTAIQEIQSELNNSIESFSSSVEEARQLATETKESAKELIAKLGPITGEIDEGSWNDDDENDYYDIDGGVW